MAYDPTNWQSGDVIFADKLNKIENGIKSIDDEYIVTNWQNGDIITADKSNKIENSIKSIDDEYIVTNWKNGDIITADKLNKIEQALAKQTSISTYELFPEQEYAIDQTSSPMRIPAFQNVNNEYFVEGAEVSLTIAGMDAPMVGFVEKGIPSEILTGTSIEPLASILYGEEETLVVILSDGTNEFVLGINPVERTNSDFGVELVIEQGLVSMVEGTATLSATSTIGKKQPVGMATEFHVTLTDECKSPRLRFNLEGKAKIDWGDDTAHSRIRRSGIQTPSHQYETAGEYTIIVTVTGSASLIGDSSKNSSCFTDSSGSAYSAYAACVNSVAIGGNITEIGNWAFYRCANLTSIATSEGVTNIGNSAFNMCSNLTSITIPNGVTTIGTSAFYKCTNLKNVTIPESVTSIGQNAFDGCSSFTNIVIPNGVTAIANNVFANCTNLSSVVIPEGVTSIGHGAFYVCSSLTNIVLPTAISIIDQNLFGKCSSLASITIPEGVSKIDYAAFSGCTSLAEVTLPSTLTTIANDAFKNCESLESVTIPESVMSIGQNAFNGCSSLVSANVPGTVIEIDLSCFSGCTSLANLTISEGVQLIDNSAFYNTISLTSITIPSTITKIGSNAFSYNKDLYSSNLITVYMRPTTPPTLSQNIFTSGTPTTIYIPTGSLEAYSNASVWSNLASKFVEMDM